MIAAHTARYKRAIERDAKKRKVDESVEVEERSSGSDNVMDAEMQMEVIVNCIDKLEDEVTRLREYMHHVQQSMVFEQVAR